MWNSDYNISTNKVFSIGFYGGEPLLNFKLIKNVVLYVNDLKTDGVSFKFNMTTNALLLDKYIDFLEKEDFRIMISLDGDEYASSYRVDKKKNSHFDEIIKNITGVKNKYPIFFDNNITFNTVLHDRNSVLKSTNYIYDKFAKIPRISELNTSGVSNNKKKEFDKIFNSKSNSYAEALNNRYIKDVLGYDNEFALNFHNLLISYTGNHFSSFTDLLKCKIRKYIPSGTCKPFEKKIYMTVNGKILPCEKIGQSYPLAYINKEKIEIDCDNISKIYTSIYKQLINSCSKCYKNTNCSQCFFFLNYKDENFKCNMLESKKSVRGKLSMLISYAETHNKEYNELLSNIAIE